VINVKRHHHRDSVELQLKPLQSSESRVLLLFASKDAAIEILTAARDLNLTESSYVWIVGKSVIGSSEFDIAPDEYHAGLIGLHYSSNNEELQIEVSRAIAIISNGLEQLTRDNANHALLRNSESDPNDTFTSSCSSQPDEHAVARGDLFYRYFRHSSPDNVFDPNGSLRDVRLNVVNLNNQGRWKRIGYWTGTTLKIDDITWPGQAKSPPTGKIQRFHLRAVFLEEPMFVNIADLDSKTQQCKTSHSVKCRFRPFTSLELNGTSTTAEPVSAVNNRTANVGGEYEYKCCSGLCIDLMEKLAADLQFTYDLYRVTDGYWGILSDKGTWNGLILELLEHRADVVVTSIKINSDRQKVVDFTVPFLDSGISILVKKQTGVISKLAFLEPFSTGAWLMILGCGIPIAAVSILLFEWLSPSGFYANSNRNRNRRRHESTSDESFSLCRSLWLVVSILFESAVHIDSPKGYTARFMGNVWATFAVVFLAVYTANLTTFMVTREEYLDLSGIDDARLVGAADPAANGAPDQRHAPLRIGTLPGGNTEAVLRSNKPNLYKYARRYNRSSSTDGAASVRSGELDAFIYDSVVLDNFASSDPECKLVNVGSWYSMTGYGLAFPRNSHHFQKFNMKLLEYRKNGNPYFYSLFSLPLSQCIDFDFDSPPSTLSLSHNV
ncbi:Glutamate receptor ionotropic, NMDA 2A, partial [Fragariocoptes setiger]